ncbi:MAG: hypothetical protein FH756_17140 [Firmicutes bacterium]|nr:hypothetical protein [Bacillota bacterium]
MNNIYEVVDVVYAVNPSNCKGIDVSHWQGDINWNLVKNDGIYFSFIKATEGVDYEDPKFTKNLKEGKKAGVLVGGYHFCTPSSEGDALNEAKYFINVTNKNGGFRAFDLPPVIDIEKDNGLNREKISKIVRTWVEYVKKETKVQPIIYSYKSFIKEYLDESLFDIPLWLAHYDIKQAPGLLGWKSWLFWQYTDKGHVNGINGAVDLNLFHSNLKELHLLCSP